MDMDDVSLSGESLIEEDEDGSSIGSKEDLADKEDDSASESSFVIDLPGVPVTASAEGIDEAETEAPPAKKQKTSTETPFESIEKPFYGFNPSAVAKSTIQIDTSLFGDEKIDLTSPVDLELILRYPDNSEELSLTMKTTAPSKVVARAAEANESSPQVPKQVKVTPKPSLPVPVMRQSREWKPSAQFFKPLSAGWVREVIYDRDDSGNYCEKPKEIVYYAPYLPGTKPRKFRSLAELGSFLSSSLSEFTLNNFSFRKEPMNASKGQEIRRAVDEVVEIFAQKPATETPPPTARRKSTATESPSQQTSSSKQTVSKLVSSGSGLKVKIFSRMKEKNIALASPTKESDSSSKKIDESFDLVSPQQKTIFEKPGMKLKMSIPESVTSLLTSSPSVTITPAGAASVAQQQSSVVDASRVKNGKVGVTISSPATHDRRSVSTQPLTMKKKILRPTKMVPVTCSIHCPLSNNTIPELSCASCHSLFHPKCVGLSDGMNCQSYDFYCYECTPPAGKENNEPLYKKSAPGQLQAGSRIKNVESPSGFTSSTMLPSSTVVSVTSATGNAFLPLSSALSITPSSSPGASVMAASGKKPPVRIKRPLRPLEAQAVINIGGIKYLVVPKSYSQPQKPQNDTTNVISSDDRPPMILKPVETEAKDLPNFEVRENADGQLLLTILSNDQEATPLRKVVKKSTQESSAKQSKYKLPDMNFTSSLGAQYFSLIQVFKYLTLTERLIASQVCKVWREVAQNSSLWKTISLANCHVSDWTKFSDQIMRVRTSKLDFRKMLVQTDHEESWTTGLINMTPRLFSLRHIELQKIPSGILKKVIEVFGNNPLAKLTNVIVHDVTCGGGRDSELVPLDLTPFTLLKDLEQLKLRSIGGPLRVENLSECIKFFAENFAESLSSLSFLNLDVLTQQDLTVISKLKNLKVLELGNCSKLTSWTDLGQLQKLNRLRLESGKIDNELVHFEKLHDLTNLELIDFELEHGFGAGLTQLKSLKQVLLIPSYKNEVAKLNFEIVETVSKMENISHFYFGLINEWLESPAAKDPNGKGSMFPIVVKDEVEYLPLPKVTKMFVSALPKAKRVSVLKMSRKATTKQYLCNMKR